MMIDLLNAKAMANNTVTTTTLRLVVVAFVVPLLHSELELWLIERAQSLRKVHIKQTSWINMYE